MPLRLLLIDDFDFVRAGLRSILASKSDWQMCGEAVDGVTAIARVLELAPDIVILDMTMPVMNAFEAAKEIRRLAPSTKIIPSAFTMFLLTMFLSTAFQQTPSFQNSVVATVSLLRLSG